MILEIKNIKPQDSTTNPSLILKFIKEKGNESFLEEVLGKYSHTKDPCSLVKALEVELGKKILTEIEGRVSIELDPRLSYDTNKTVEEAKFIIEQFEKANIPRKRILVKIASTWQGIQAAKTLQSDHKINCNMTLVFSRFQVSIN
jgi:transaldolase